MDDSKVESEVVLSSKRGTKEQVTLATATSDVDVLLDAGVVTDARKVVPPAPSEFSSQHGQLLLRGPEPTKALQLRPQDPEHRTLPLNDLTAPITIDSEIFSGQLVLTFRGTPSTPQHLFEGRRRRMWLALQGRFKRPVPLDALYFGTFLSQPLHLPASSLLTTAAVWLVNRLGGGAQLDVSSPRPFVKAPLIAAAQQVHVALPGEAPGLMEAGEDMRLFDSALYSSWTGGAMSAAKRQAWFRSPGKRAGRCYSPDHVYTFHIYDQALDYSTFQLLLPLFPIDLVQVLGCQPLTVAVCDDQTGEKAMEVEIWHQRMLVRQQLGAAQPLAGKQGEE